MLGIDMVTRVGQYMWIPILNDDGANAGKDLIQMSEGKMPERFPVRLLQAYGLATKHIKVLSNCLSLGCNPFAPAWPSVRPQQRADVAHRLGPRATNAS